MPRNVRPFWVELEVDGQKKVAAGPKSLTGGIDLTIRIREGGAISKKTLKVEGYRVGDALHLAAYIDGPGVEHEPIRLTTKV